MRRSYRTHESKRKRALPQPGHRRLTAASLVSGIRWGSRRVWELLSHHVASRWHTREMDGGGRSRCVIMRCFGIRWSHVRPLGGAASSCDDDEISRGASAHGGTGIVRVLGPGPWSSAVSGVDRGQHLVVRTSARQRSTPRRSHQRPTAFRLCSVTCLHESLVQYAI